tara:strand:- start:1531 stop:1773 length:243 start_codon:yes stop_codon:yes gene_type:complete
MNTQITNEEQIKAMLSNVDIDALMSVIHQRDDVFMPQSYTEEHMGYYGFESIKAMKHAGRYMYYGIDEMMKEAREEAEEA